jgi:5'-methylthioadenosine phosphorylase
MAEIPRVDIGLLSGSAGWGIRFPDDLDVAGVRVTDRGLTFQTPYGRTENWQVIELDGTLTADGRPRRVLNVFAHGWPMHEIDHSVTRTVGWVLQQAGVSKLIADSTCGSLNRALQPRDLVLSADVLDLSQTQYSLLPGRFKYLCRGVQMFCPSMGDTIEKIARASWPVGARVYGHANQLVAAHCWGPRFETGAESRAYRLLGADILNQSITQEATMARELGACFASLSYVVTFLADYQGQVPSEWGVDQVHHELARLALLVVLQSLANVSLTDECGCRTYRTERPAQYAVGAPDTGN